MVGASDLLEITTEELIRTIESGAPIRVLDVRAPAALASGRIDILPADRFLNLRGSEVLTMGDALTRALPPDGPIAVVCARGNASKQVAVHLNDLGYQARSVQGGMLAWGDALMPRDLEPPAGLDLLLQFDRVAKGALGYLVGSAGEAWIIDPPRKALAMVEAARDRGFHVVGVADTHAHADYISGGPALARSLGIPYHLHPRDAILPYDGSPAKIAYQPLHDGERLRVGNAEITVEHTPGHTEGSVTYGLGDGAALTGDFVFVQSIGRPDLGGKTDEWTPVLWNSLERARESWKPGRVVYPAHYASDAERETDRTVGRPFGSLPERNEPLRIKDATVFVTWVKERVGASPEAYRKIKALNLGLLEVWEMEAQELDCGRNACALG